MIAGTPPPYDPYTALIGSAPQPYTAQQMRQIIGQYTSGLPQPMGYGQIQQRATDLISPLIQAITASINQQAASGADRIRGLTASTAHEISQIPFAQPYQQAEQAQSATDAALHQALSGAGSSDANALASRLAVINDPSVAQAAAAVNANGQGNANASLAQGTDAMSNLIAQAAAAGSFGQKLPAIAQLSGIQQLGGLAQDTTNQIASASQQLEGQVPGLVQNFLSQSDNARTTRAQAAQQLFQYLNDTSGSRAKDILSLETNQLGRNDALNAGAAKNATSVAETNAKLALQKYGIDVRASTAQQATQVRATTARQAAAAKASQQSFTNRLAFVKTYHYDPVTHQPQAGYTIQNGQVVKTGTTKSGQKPPTANQINSWITGWKSGKPTEVTVKEPNPDSNGNTVYRTVRQNQGQLNYLQAYKRLRSLGVPDQQARQSLDSAYKRGEQGRTWLTNEERAALRGHQGIPDHVQLYKGQPWITSAQVILLKQARRLPPGELVNGRYFIAPVY